MPVFRMTVDLRFGAGTGRGTNTWHFRTGVDFLPDDDLSPLTNIVQQFYVRAASVLPASYTYAFDGSLTEILTAEPQVVQAASTWSGNGTANGTGYGAAAGMGCVTWRSNLATRSGRGRTFVGPLVSTAVQENGSLTDAALLILREAGDNLVSASNTNDNVGAICVFSPTDNLARDIVASSVTDQVAILRSRRS